MHNWTDGADFHELFEGSRLILWVFRREDYPGQWLLQAPGLVGHVVLRNHRIRRAKIEAVETLKDRIYEQWRLLRRIEEQMKGNK